MSGTIDLNADLGEGFGPWRLTDDEGLMPLLSSANVAAGGHASDPATMRATVRLAVRHGVRIGAHPGFPDKVGFGRRRLPYTPDEVTEMVAAQTGALIAVAALEGGRVDYVKAHGALGNWSSEDEGICRAVLAGARAALGPEARLMAIAGTAQQRVCEAEGAPHDLEVFLDRAYTNEGLLAPRSTPGAVLTDADEAADRMVAFLESGAMPTVDGGKVRMRAESICVHGDTPGAVAAARLCRERLEGAGWRIAAPS